MSLSNHADEEPDPGPELLTELRTPLEIVNRQRQLLYFLGRSTHKIRRLREEFVDAKDAYNKKAFASQLALAGKGSEKSREQAAQLEHWDLYIAMKVAEKALEYSKDKRKDLEVELSQTQSETKLVISEMSLAGRVN